MRSIPINIASLGSTWDLPCDGDIVTIDTHHLPQSMLRQLRERNTIVRPDVHVAALVRDEVTTRTVLRDAGFTVAACGRTPTTLIVLVARRPSGHTITWPVITVDPSTRTRPWHATRAPISDDLVAQAESVAVSIADGIDAAGILAVEMSVHESGIHINRIGDHTHPACKTTTHSNATSYLVNHLHGLLDRALQPTTPMTPRRDPPAKQT